MAETVRAVRAWLAGFSDEQLIGVGQITRDPGSYGLEVQNPPGGYSERDAFLEVGILPQAGELSVDEGEE